MNVYFDIREIDLQVLDKPVVSLGTFDGVHLGHQAVVKKLLHRAKQRDKAGLVVTYEPHPQSVVAPGSAPQVLTTLEEKLDLFEKLGVKDILVINFDAQLSQFEAQDFVEEILVKKLNVGGVIVGHDHAFGSNRSGKTELLAQTSKKYAFELEVLPPVRARVSPRDSAETDGGERISSTKIRRELKEGDFGRGISMLGHSYPIWGEATKGKGRGKNLDYPTINLETSPSKLLPKEGVYATKVQIQDRIHFGMLHIGAKPTFGDSSPSTEVHLLDAEPEQIDSEVRLFVESWIREVQRFDTPALLKDQLRVDERRIKEMFHID
jgi:riboflavin kinase/FMN adenylyltransferase